MFASSVKRVKVVAEPVVLRLVDLERKSSERSERINFTHVFAAERRGVD